MPGITPEGFEILRLPQIVEEMAARHRTDYGQGFDTGSRTPIGQLDGALGEREASIWEAMEEVHDGHRLFGAQGPALDDFAALVGLTRLPAISTTVDVLLAGTPAAVIPAGTEFRITDTDRLFTLEADATVGGGGTVAAELVASSPGPVVARAGAAWTIVTPVAGLTSLSNALDGETGRLAEEDGPFRGRVLAAFTGPGNALDALVAALYRRNGVTEVRVIENDLAWTDPDGRPPHSFEAIVVGGVDQDIADAIWVNKPAGIRPYGLTVLSSIDSEGGAHDVGLTRPADVLVWIEVDVVPRVTSTSVGTSTLQSTTYPANGADLIEEAILAIEPGLRAGMSFPAWRILDAIAEALPAESLERVTVRLGTTASPTGDATVTVTARQRVALDSTRIDVDDGA